MKVYSRAREYGTYVLEALRNFRRMSAVAPTSVHVLKKINALIPENTKRIVEIGVGGGGLVRMMLETNRLHPDGTLIALEPNDNLRDVIRDSVHDDRVTILPDLAQNLSAVCREHLDAPPQVIITSIPLSVMHAELQREIIGTVAANLDADGTFIVYIFNDVSPLLHEFFGEVESRKVHGHKLPPIPYMVHTARKPLQRKE